MPIPISITLAFSSQYPSVVQEGMGKNQNTIDQI